MKVKVQGKDQEDAMQKALDIGMAMGVYILCKVLTSKAAEPDMRYFEILQTQMAYQVEEKTGVPAEDFMANVGASIDDLLDK